MRRRKLLLTSIGIVAFPGCLGFVDFGSNDGSGPGSVNVDAGAQGDDPAELTFSAESIDDFVVHGDSGAVNVAVTNAGSAEVIFEERAFPGSISLTMDRETLKLTREDSGVTAVGPDETAGTTYTFEYDKHAVERGTYTADLQIAYERNGTAGETTLTLELTLVGVSPD